MWVKKVDLVGYRLKNADFWLIANQIGVKKGRFSWLSRKYDVYLQNNNTSNIKKMNKIIILLISCMLGIMACTTSTTTSVTCTENEDGLIVMNVNFPGDEQVQFKDLIDSVRIVVLDESVDEALIGKFTNNIHKGSGRIIVEDYTEYPVKIYDDNGKFIKAIRKGQGPGEMESASASCYNVTTEEYITYNGGTISIFDKDGNFKSKVQAPFHFQQMTCLNGDYLFYVENWELPEGFESNDSLQCAFIVTDKDFKIKYKALPFAKNSEKTVSYSGPDSQYFRHLGDRVEFPNQDTIYSYDGYTLTPKMYVEYDNKLLSKPADMKHAKSMSYINNGYTQVFSVGSHNDFEQQQIVRDVTSGHFYSVFHSCKKHSLNGYLFSWTRALEDHSMCIALDPNLAYYGNEIANNIIPELKPLSKQMEEDETHLLILFKFKHF